MPEGATIGVDGVFYSRTVTMVWPVGSKHTLTALSGGTGVFDTQYSFDHWDANGIALPGPTTINVTADPAIREIRAIFLTSYALNISFFDCPECFSDYCVKARKEMSPVPSQCQSPGTVYVDSEPVIADKKVFKEAGATLRLTAVPNENYVFAGWVPGDGQTILGFINTVVLNRPTVVHPRFVYARRVNLTTEPPGLDLLADRGKVDRKEHTSELQSLRHLVCRLLLEKKKK